MIEAFLLTIFVGAIVSLMKSISRAAKPGETRTLGIFSYTVNEKIDATHSSTKV